MPIVLGVNASQQYQFPSGNWELAANAAALGIDNTAWSTFCSTVGGDIFLSRYGLGLQNGPTGGSLGVNYASASKPFISVAIWKAIADGIVASTTSLIKDYDTARTYNSKDDGINIYHLGHMTSGFGRPEDPGVALAYNDYAINLYGRATIGADIYDETATNVFRNEFPLGYQDSPVLDSSTQYCRLTDVSLRDFNRFMLMCMARGKWQTTQIVPSSYFISMEQNTLASNFTLSSGADITPSFDPGSFGGGYFNETSSQEARGTYSWNFWNNVNALLFTNCPTDTIAAIGHVGLEVGIYIRSLGIVITWATDEELTNSQINTALSTLLASVDPL